MDTAEFLEMCTNMWKILNCKSQYEHIKRNDPFRSSIDATPRGQAAISYLERMASVANMMTHSGSQKEGEKRMFQLTRDTGEALRDTLRGLVHMSKYLMSPASGHFQHKYVLLGFFQQDDLEQHFGHFRRSAGCNYYISVRDVMMTHSIDRARIMLEKKMSCLEHVEPAFHQCEHCDEALGDDDLKILDQIAETDNICQFIDTSVNELNVIVYTAGYVAYKHPELKGSGQDIPSNLKKYIDGLNRGKLSYPSKIFLTYMFMTFAFMKKCSSSLVLCRKRMTILLTFFPGLFNLKTENDELFNLSEAAKRTVANIFLNNRQNQFNTDQSEASSRKKKKLASQ